MTPTAEALIRELRSEAAHWDDVTTTDAPAVARYRAEARRDALDRVIALLRSRLPDIEAEAVEEASRIDAWLDAGAGVPSLSIDTEHGRVEVPMG